MRSSISSSNVLTAVDFGSAISKAPSPWWSGGVFRQLCYVLLGVLLFFFADRLISTALWACISHSEFRYSVLYHRPVNASVVILGNSRGMALVDWPYMEAQTGKKLFSLTYNGIATPLSRLLFQDYLDRNPAPEVVVIEISQVLGDETLIQELKLYERASPRIQKLLKDRYPRLAAGITLSHLYAFNGEMLLRNLFYLRKSDHDWLIDGRITPSFLEESARLPKLTWAEPDPAKVEALAATVRLAKERGIKVHLVVGPYLPQFLQSITNSDSVFRQIGISAGIPIIDYSHALTNPDEFADRIHINRLGAQQMTNRMIREGIFN
jgi:hypothetical protein